MANVDPLIAHRPEFADTQPDLGTLSRPAAKTALGRFSESAGPFLVGAGVGAGITLAVAALSSRKQARFTLFPVSRSTLFGSVAKVALIAAARAVLRRSLERAVAKFAIGPA